MNRNKTFCEECRRDVEYMVETATIKGKLKGEEYEYTGKKAVCTECGSEVYVADIEDENLKALYDTYRQKNGIISLEKILENTSEIQYWQTSPIIAFRLGRNDFFEIL
jgi:hypothetical protein